MVVDLASAVGISSVAVIFFGSYEFCFESSFESRFECCCDCSCACCCEAGCEFYREIHFDVNLSTDPALTTALNLTLNLAVNPVVSLCLRDEEIHLNIHHRILAGLLHDGYLVAMLCSILRKQRLTGSSL